MSVKNIKQEIVNTVLGFVEKSKNDQYIETEESENDIEWRFIPKWTGRHVFSYTIKVKAVCGHGFVISINGNINLINTFYSVMGIYPEYEKLNGWVILDCEQGKEVIIKYELPVQVTNRKDVYMYIRYLD